MADRSWSGACSGLQEMELEVLSIRGGPRGTRRLSWASKRSRRGTLRKLGLTRIRLGLSTTSTDTRHPKWPLLIGTISNLSFGSNADPWSMWPLPQTIGCLQIKLGSKKIPCGDPPKSSSKIKSIEWDQSRDSIESLSLFWGGTHCWGSSD